VCLIFAGDLYPQILGAAQLLKDKGVNCDMYNLRFLCPIDEEYLTSLLNSYDLVVFIEEGIRRGGFGEYAASLAHCRNVRANVMVLAVDEDFAARGNALGTRDELLRDNGLDSNGIAQSIFNNVQTRVPAFALSIG
jgi:1-deoxy-D-xylulose-5-phosphate synthase